MLQFLQSNWGTIVAAAVVILLVFLAARRLLLDKRAGIGICGQKCSQCPKFGHCDEAAERPELSCDGVCASCRYGASCPKKQ